MVERIRPADHADIGRFRDLPIIALDIGFSRTQKSCGLAWRIGTDLGSDALTFGTCVKKISSLLASALKDEKAFVIEAPLSGSFDGEGNPQGRGAFEQSDRNGLTKGSRYWYTGPGASTCLAATFLLQRLLEDPAPENVVLFEGFVTFKNKGSRGQHAHEARLLRACLLQPETADSVSVTPPSGGRIVTVLQALGGSAEAPLVIMPRGKEAEFTARSGV